VTEFADVAFNLNDPKKISRIVETEYGYHIIQLIEKKGERINCRHILLRPHVSAQDKIHSLEKLDSIRSIITDSASATFEQAVLYFSQDKQTAMNAGVMMNPNTGSSKFEYQDLPQDVAKQIYQLKVGEISEPFLMMDETKNKEVCAIVKLKAKNDVHKANMVDDFQVIRSMLEQHQANEFIEDWIKKKQKEVYVHIDDKWRGCDFQYPGWVHE